MDDKTIWPPAPKNQSRYSKPTPRRYFFIKIPLLAFGLGLVLGFWDIHCTSNLVDWITFGVTAYLGFLHPKTFLLSAFLLTLSLYLIHVTAIQHGFKQPYVEPNADQAIYCWQSAFPNSLGGLIGAVVKVFVKYEPMGPQSR